jgi:hypothetical protein
VVRRAERAARDSTTRSTSLYTYSPIRSANASSSARACAAYHDRTYFDARRALVGCTPMRSYTSFSSSRSNGSSYCAVLTRISRQLNAASSTPVASRPDSSACTSVVPEPANGSSTWSPRVK